MKNVVRAYCLLLIFYLLSIPLFAAGHDEEFSQPVGNDYTLIDNLAYVNNIGSILSIVNPPDVSGVALSNRTETGSVVFKAAGAQTIRVGFYAKYGLYANYSSGDDTYRFCEPAAGGRLLPVLYDAAAQSFYVQDGETRYYLAYDYEVYALCFQRLDPATVGEPAPLSYAFINIYASADGRAYTRVTHNIVQIQSGEALNTFSDALYCQIAADLPAGSKYIKVEINQPNRMITSVSPLQWSQMPSPYCAILANVHFTGEQLVMGGTDDTSSSPISSQPTDNSSSNSSNTGSSHSSRESGRDDEDDDAPSRLSDTADYPDGQDTIGLGSPTYRAPAVPEQPVSESKEISDDVRQQTSAEPSIEGTQSDGVVNADSKRASTVQTASGSNDFEKVVIAGAGIATVLGMTYIIIKFARGTGHTTDPMSKGPSRTDDEESS